MEFFTVAEIAGKLRLSVSQVYALIDAGKLRAHRFTTRRRGAVRVSAAQLSAYLTATEAPVTASRGEADELRDEDEWP